MLYILNYRVNNKNMKKLYFKKTLMILIPIIILMIISFLNLKNAALISSAYSGYLIKQIVWYGLSFIVLIIIYILNPPFLIKNSFYLYLCNVLLLFLVLFIGKEVNGSRAWFDLGIFAFQPSELMKVTLLFYLTKVVGDNAKKILSLKEEFFLLIRIIIIVFIPSILTFLEPDTGAIIMYFIITLAILFFSKIRKRWLVFGMLLTVCFASLFIFMYLKKQDTFINIFGTSFFYRMDRLIDFKNQNGLQLENALIASGSAGVKGHGMGTIALYFPEAPTDFAFALSLSTLGLRGGFLILLSFLILDVFLILQLSRVKDNYFKIFLAGFLGMFIYQQFQNILMNIGLLPIVGITLPFVSYGGSSILIYFICMGFILNFIIKKISFEDI